MTNTVKPCLISNTVILLVESQTEALISIMISSLNNHHANIVDDWRQTHPSGIRICSSVRTVVLPITLKAGTYLNRYLVPGARPPINNEKPTCGT